MMLSDEVHMQLLELVEKNDIDGLEKLLKRLDTEHNQKLEKLASDLKRKKLGKFADFLEIPDYNLNSIYKNGKSLMAIACDNSNLKMMKLLVDYGANL